MLLILGVLELLLAGKLRDLQTCFGRARLLANFELLDHAPEEINTLLDHYAAVTPSQVQEVAKSYLNANQRVALSIQPESAGSPGAGVPPTEGER